MSYTGQAVVRFDPFIFSGLRVGVSVVCITPPAHALIDCWYNKRWLCGVGINNYKRWQSGASINYYKWWHCGVSIINVGRVVLVLSTLLRLTGLKATSN